MKLLKIIIMRFQKALSQIHLIDKCLIIIMSLLLFQSAYSLHLNTATALEINTIDIIIRTATASIFGYFLSSNFICHSNQNDDFLNLEEKKRNSSKEMRSNSIYLYNSSETQSDIENFKENISQKSSPEPYITHHLQIIITTTIAFFCLLILIVVRDTPSFSEADLTASSLATISQFRDLISGCIGFLIGVPTTKK